MEQERKKLVDIRKVKEIDGEEFDKIRIEFCVR
jgi:hypothetical protein